MDMLHTLKPAAFHILLALAEHDSHGYAVMQTVRQQSGGRVPLQTGSFYRHLSQLIDAGLVVEASGPKTGDDPRRGTYYRLTASGRQALAAEKTRLTELVAHLNKVRLTTRKGDA
jgi:DNA-binding PadR family transcriptional regulator